MTLGQKIIEYRQEHELSVRAFARMANLSPTYVSYLETGKTQRGNHPVASIETYKSVAKAMKMKLDDLLCEVEDEVAVNRKSAQKVPDGLDAELVTLFSLLPVEDKAKVLGFVKGLIASREA